MYTCSCEVSKKFNKCSNLTHIAALDYRAATYEAMLKVQHAQRDAEWLLEIAPRSIEVKDTGNRSAWNARKYAALGANCGA
jgi:hypothetical protein